MNSNTLKIDDLLRFMVQQEASDLHLKPMRPPLIRLHGKLLPLKAEPISPDVLPQLLDAIMSERHKSTLVQDLAVDFGYSVPGVSRFRASVFHQRGTLSAVFRRVPFHFPSLADWGLPPVLNELTGLTQGLVLITGPTGAGKSSTLAALIREIAENRLVHVVTIEDPIEFLLKDKLGAITQREIGTDTPSFQHALRNALRQDPDVIMVGEMRDAATIQIVLTAAETGHLVFSTVHTNSAAQTVDRIIDSFPEGNHRQIRQQLASVLQAIVSMKLVPTRDGESQVAAVEILRRTPRVSSLILKGQLEALEEELENSVSYHKMQSMNQSLAALVLNGVISAETALLNSGNPGDLDLILRRFMNKAATGEGEMGEPLSDYSKIHELQEIRKLYEEQHERHAEDLAARDRELVQLRQALAQAERSEAAGEPRFEELEQENSRLTGQLQQIREEYEAKLERLNARLREISAGPAARPSEPTDPARRGFFRR